MLRCGVVDTVMNDDDSSGSDGSEFMSPFAPLRHTFPSLRKKEVHKIPGETIAIPHHESSFLVSSDKVSQTGVSLDDDEEDYAATAPYRRVLSESMNLSFTANERTALLGSRTVDRHVLSSGEQDASSKSRSSRGANSRRQIMSWGSAVCVLSGLHMAMMGLHDVYLRYISYRRGYDSNKVLAWRLPWLSPSDSTLRRFGVLMPYRVLHGQPWRLLTSLLMSTSMIEYLLILGAWRVFQKGSSPKAISRSDMWTGLCYVLAAFTGQLWTVVWDVQSLSGALSWGTCGVLFAAGVEQRDARQRFLLLVISTALVVVSLVEPTNSILGSIGSSLLGLIFYGVGWTRHHAPSHREKEPLSERMRLLSGMGLLVLWILPLLWLAASPETPYYQ